ncbi:MAG: hypothetical protein GX893_03770 [Firmicutes bacterium]|nr:hypothetical protein [Bacillota bacterium]
MSDPLKRARSIAYRLLARRARTVKQMRTSLLKKKIPADISEQLIAELQTAGYLNDVQYIQNYVEYQLSNFRGPLWLRASLLRAGVNAEMIDEILPTYFPPGREEELAMAYLKKIKKKILLTPQKAARRLIYRGFNRQVVWQVVKSLYEKTEA